MAHQLDKNDVIRWLLANGFKEVTGKSTGHRFFERDGIKLTLLGHGRNDIPKQHVAQILRALEKLGYRRSDVRKQLKDF